MNFNNFASAFSSGTQGQGFPNVEADARMVTSSLMSALDNMRRSNNVQFNSGGNWNPGPPSGVISPWANDNRSTGANYGWQSSSYTSTGKHVPSRPPQTRKSAYVNTKNNSTSTGSTKKTNYKERQQPKKVEQQKATEIVSPVASTYEDVNKDLLYCSVCDKKLPNATVFEAHVKGKAHSKAVEVVDDIHVQMLELMRSYGRLVTPIKNVQSRKNERRGTKGQVREKCAMCNLTIEGCSLKNHRQISAEHRSIKEFLYPACNVCNIRLDSRSKWDTHRLSAAHLKAMTANKKTQPRKEYFHMLHVLLNHKGEETVKKNEPSQPEKSDTQAKETSTMTDDEVVPFDQEKAFGTSFVKPVNGFFCRVCKKFLTTDMDEHCRSRSHYDKSVEVITLNKTKEKVAQKKRPAVETNVDDDDSGKWKRQRKTKDDAEEEGEKEPEKNEVEQDDQKDEEEEVKNKS